MGNVLLPKVCALTRAEDARRRCLMTHVSVTEAQILTQGVANHAATGLLPKVCALTRAEDARRRCLMTHVSVTEAQLLTQGVANHAETGFKAKGCKSCEYVICEANGVRN